jgi:hypothetical protein
MDRELQGWQTKVLGGSRVVGWGIGAGVIALLAFTVGQISNQVRERQVRGQAEARVFIEKVRACHRAPPPHPSWPDCEHLVRNRE